MVDVISIISIAILVISGGFIFFGIPITIFLFKDKLFFWPRQTWRIMVYEAEIKEVEREQQLIGTDGKPLFDTRGNPVTNIIKTGEKQIVVSDKLVVDGLCWKVKKKIIPWLYVDRGWLKGFNLDLSYLAYVAPTDKGERIIRVAQLSKGVWEGGNFYPLGQPDVTVFDARHSIFAHKIDKATIDQSISAMEATAWVDFQKNRARKDENQMLKILEMMAPVIIVVLVLIVVIFTYDYANKSMSSATGLVDSHLRTCEAGYAIQTNAPVANTTQSGAPAVKLPFG